MLGAGGPMEFWRAYGAMLLAVSWMMLLTLSLICGSSRLGLISTEQQVWGAFCLVQMMVAGLSWAVLQYELHVFWGRSEPISNGSWFLVRNLLVSAILSAMLLGYERSQQRWREKFQAESRVRLNALQSRIRPHFLFNTLNTISSLIHDRPDQAEQATLDLADLLRTGLKDESSHSLSDEFELIHGYLRIEQLRLGERMNIAWQLADDVPLDQQLPPLLLQPLVENAVIHGISRRAEGGRLKIEARKIRFARLRFTVTNPLADPDSRPAEGNQSALENIRQRLALAYEERYGLKTWIEDGHFIAELTVPVT